MYVPSYLVSWSQQVPDPAKAEICFPLALFRI
jgi:hypothetical protein